jgi:superfamily I DNA and/or RNA helicase
VLHFCAAKIAAKACGVMKLSELQDRERKRARDDVRTAIEHAEVICCASMEAVTGMLMDYRVPEVLLDEAAQATEPATLVPICNVCARLALLGDHFQLPPTVMWLLAGCAGSPPSSSSCTGCSY